MQPIITQFNPKGGALWHLKIVMKYGYREVAHYTTINKNNLAGYIAFVTG